ncbi:hypothetical protein [Nostoc sphaeroides]|uniref:Uncharacterized protein n=2 Tax=Nostoc sphaeroides TaxID=446679 RepID=A0A5P8WBY2_9NOSO|nr:hypothetical protein [Nostoc sphaeroides]QFS50333.1 hypothetical protein GXM_07827 [Nostoc sphaeroides CCNUC1]
MDWQLRSPSLANPLSLHCLNQRRYHYQWSIVTFDPIQTRSPICVDWESIGCCTN